MRELFYQLSLLIDGDFKKSKLIKKGQKQKAVKSQTSSI